MKIIIAGNEAAHNECMDKLGPEHEYQTMNILSDGTAADLIVDFTDERPDQKWSAYAGLQTPAFINSVSTTLNELNAKVNFNASVFGFCGWPGFFNRTPIEVSLLNTSHQPVLNQLAKQLNIETIIVKDQPGMIAPRVVAMIINEALETLQQGVASREDIDLSMKLGTNYPYGPFEWADKIGLQRVRNLLIALSKTDSRFQPNF